MNSKGYELNCVFKVFCLGAKTMVAPRSEKLRRGEDRREVLAKSVRHNQYYIHVYVCNVTRYCKNRVLASLIS